MRAAPFVDHGARRVRPHPRGAEQMPAAPRDRVVDADVGSTGGFENFPSTLQPVVHHLPAVLADRVVDLRRGNAVSVFQYRIERDAVMFLGQILADRGDAEAMAIEPAEDA